MRKRAEKRRADRGLARSLAPTVASTKRPPYFVLFVLSTFPVLKRARGGRTKDGGDAFQKHKGVCHNTGRRRRRSLHYTYYTLRLRRLVCSFAHDAPLAPPFPTFRHKNTRCKNLPFPPSSSSSCGSSSPPRCSFKGRVFFSFFTAHFLFPFVLNYKCKKSLLRSFWTAWRFSVLFCGLIYPLDTLASAKRTVQQREERKDNNEAMDLCKKRQ